jgi:flagellar FliL protein
MPEGNPTEGEEGKAPASKKKLIIIISAIVLVLLIGGGAAFFLMSGDDAENVDATDAVKTEEVVEEVNANYVPMPRPIVFNVLDGTRDRTVQIKVQLMVMDKSSEALTRKHVPLLESTLVSVFSAAPIEQLRSPQGKSELRETALTELNKATTLVEKRALIHTVLFTGFVLQ